MSTHPNMLLAYNAAGDVISTRDYCVQYAEDRTPLGLVDFAAHEEAGGAHSPDIWTVEQFGSVPLDALSYVCPGGSFLHGDELCLGGEYRTPAKGSKVWPEWLGSRAHDFRVELVGPAGNKRIGALVHKASGHRRERAAIEAAIDGRIKAAKGEPADIRDLVGGPDRPIYLDEQGRNAPRPKQTRPKLPLVAASASANQQTG